MLELWDISTKEGYNGGQNRRSLVSSVELFCMQAVATGFSLPSLLHLAT
jgi:hypothetical protein